ncbi:hypothetical protein LZ554_002622 [Drepanopeziza brunnea f. sp. 'monogermtubi']|nr:hypothetical protein LZ554_002622 [Drepanopeziza brunnea f. sp. 'monogermtubi']
MPKKTLERPLSGDDDYIRRWLAQIEISNATRQATSNQDKDRLAQADFGPGAAAHISQDVLGPSRGKRRHNSSSDSSLLEVTVRPRSQHLKRNDPSPPTPRKKQRIDSSEPGVSIQAASSIQPRETFEKRPRHKTREDRYEPKKEKRSRKNDENKATRKKREKKGNRRKAAKRAGEDLMQNFSSNRIGQERLTMRPSHGPGLYNNGRASSPAKRRGLPDLAFSEMAFLQRSLEKGPSEKDTKLKSKSREKEKRQVTRAQEEISTFFRPNRIPLQEISSNQGGLSSLEIKNDHSIYEKQLDPERGTKSYTRSDSSDIPFEPIESSRRPRPSSEGEHRPMNHLPAISHPMNPPESTSRLSSKATTYVSWSESQYSPALTSGRSIVDHVPASSTPDSVRRSIENTGIFKDTGIQRTCGARHTEPHPPSGMFQNQQSRDPAQGPKSLAECSGTTAFKTTVPSETGINRSETGFYSQGDLVRPRYRGGYQDQPEEHLSRDWNERTDQTATSRQRVIVENFDPRLGWLEDPNSISRGQQTSAAAMRKATPHKSESTPVSRDEMAKHARIKLPKPTSTGMPIVGGTGSQEEKLIGLGFWGSSGSNFVPNTNGRIAEDPPEDAIGRTISDEAHIISTKDPPGPYILVAQGTGDEESTGHPVENKQPERLPDDIPSGGNSHAIFDDGRRSHGLQQSHTELGSQLVEKMASGSVQEGDNSAYRRKSWLSDIHATASSRPTRLSPILEIEPLYVQQMERHPGPSDLTPCDEPTSRVTERFEAPMDTMIDPYVEDRQYQDQQYLEPNGYSPLDHDLTAYQTYENNDLGDYHADAEYSDRFGAWGPQSQGFDGGFAGHGLFEDQGPYENGPGAGVFYAEQGVNDTHNQMYYASNYYGGYGPEPEAPGTGFWQPRRQY